MEMNKPVEVFWSGGKLCKSCLIWFTYLSSNCPLAHSIQSSKLDGFLVTKKFKTASVVVSGSFPGNFRVFAKKSSGSWRYWRADPALPVKMPSNSSRAHYETVWESAWIRVHKTNLKTVFDGIREVLQSTNWNWFFWRVTRGAIWLSDARNNDLSVTHSSKGTYWGLHHEILIKPQNIS